MNSNSTLVLQQKCWILLIEGLLMSPAGSGDMFASFLLNNTAETGEVQTESC